jgi:hypothetical protein
MLDRLRARQDGHIPIECPITFSREMVNRSGKFIDRHPNVTFGLLVMAGLAILAAIGFGVWRLVA